MPLLPAICKVFTKTYANCANACFSNTDPLRMFQEQLTGEQESAGDECPLPPLDFSEERTLFSKRG